MSFHAKSAQLKAQARDALTGHYLTLSGAFFTLFVLNYIITVPDALIRSRSAAGTIVYYALLFLFRLFFAIFTVGLAYLFLSNACGQRINMGNLFMGFSHGPGKIMQLALLPTALEFVPDCLSTYCMTRYLTDFNGQWLFYTLLALLVYVVIYCLVLILYSQIYYVTLDFPEMEVLECLRYSRKLMKGHRLQYLYLVFSFFPLVLLGAITCGIGLLYVYPYMDQTLAFYYLDLVHEQNG